MENQKNQKQENNVYDTDWLDNWINHLDEMLIEMKKSEIISEIDKK